MSVFNMAAWYETFSLKLISTLKYDSENRILIDIWSALPNCTVWSKFGELHFKAKDKMVAVINVIVLELNSTLKYGSENI